MTASLSSRIARFLAGIAGFGFAATVVHAQQPPVQPATEAAAAIWRDARTSVGLAAPMTLSASALTVRAGEQLQLTLEVPTAGYLNIVGINVYGESTVLFPNATHPDNHVAAGTLRVPGADMGFTVQASAPFGSSLLVAYLSSEKLDLTDLKDGQRNAKGMLAGPYAQWSRAGRDAVSDAVTKNFVAIPADPAPSAAAGKPAPLAAGMVVVLACAATGPCQPTPDSPVERIPDAMVPGILLEDEAIVSDAEKGFTSLRAVPAKGMLLTKSSEGFVPHLYEDVAGYCTIAYGHLLRQGGCGVSDRTRYFRGVSEPAGSDLLTIDMRRAQAAVLALVKVPLKDGQYAALCDFTFNVGSGNLRQSTLLKKVNAGDDKSVPYQLLRWTRAGGKENRGLKTRRQREIALYVDAVPGSKSFSEALQAGPKDDDLVDVRQGEPSR